MAFAITTDFVRRVQDFIVSSSEDALAARDVDEPSLVVRPSHSVAISVAATQNALPIAYGSPGELLASRGFAVANPAQRDSPWTDRAYVLEHIEGNPGVFTRLLPELQADTEITGLAIGSNPELILQVDTGRADYLELARLALSRRVLLLTEFDVASPYYDELAALVVSINPRMVGQVDPTTAGYLPLMQAAMEVDLMAFATIDEALLADAAYIIENFVDAEPSLLLSDHRGLSLIPESIRNEVWSAMMARLANEGQLIPTPVDGSYQGFLDYLAEHGIEFSGRFRSVVQALSVAGHNQDYASIAPDRRLAVVVMTQHDHNNAYEAYPLVDQLQEQGLAVVYLEADDEAALDELAEVVAGSGQLIQTLVIAGHGSPGALLLGSETIPVWQDESGYVDISDFHHGDYADLNELMAESSNLLLYSCSTGFGREGANNLANTFAQFMPGVRVYSPTMPTNVNHVQVNNDGSLAVQWREEGIDYMTQVNP